MPANSPRNAPSARRGCLGQDRHSYHAKKPSKHITFQLRSWCRRTVVCRKSSIFWREFAVSQANPLASPQRTQGGRRENNTLPGGNSSFGSVCRRSRRSSRSVSDSGYSTPSTTEAPAAARSSRRVAQAWESPPRRSAHFNLEMTQSGSSRPSAASHCSAAIKRKSSPRRHGVTEAHSTFVPACDPCL